MKTMFHLLLILMFSGALWAADANDFDARQEEIARLEERIKELRVTIPEVPDVIAMPFDVAGKDKQLAKLEVKLKDAQHRLGKLKSSGVEMVIPTPAPTPFNFHWGSGDRGLVIVPGSNTNMGQVKEDVTIMTQIMANQLHEQGLAPWTWPNGHTIETIAIDGYGVMFIMKVNFPLMDQATSPNEVQKEHEDSVWEQTRQSLHASHINLDLEQPSQAYDIDKVEKLKKILCKTLKHAANIRSLQGGQWVVVVVNDDQNGQGISVVHGVDIFTSAMGSSSAQSTLVIKANKTDIDRFAENEMDLDAFQKIVQIQTFAKP